VRNSGEGSRESERERERESSKERHSQLKSETHTIPSGRLDVYGSGFSVNAKVHPQHKVLFAEWIAGLARTLLTLQRVQLLVHFPGYSNMREGECVCVYLRECM
jgi:hypothetical protein